MPPTDSTDLTANLGSGGNSYSPPVSVGSGGSGDAKEPRSSKPPRGGERPTESGPPKGAERYLPGDELGRGGWGHVERARDRQLDRDVAVKKINGDLASASAIHDRFFHEARVTGQLQHPGIVPVHELGVGEDGAPFYVMKLLEGSTFKDTIRQAHREGHTLDSGFSVELLDRFSDICNAVAYAHQQGVLHRDLKPSNIMVGQFGETIVVDWGLAKQIDDTAEPPPAPCEEVTLAPGAVGPRGAGETPRRTPARSSSGSGSATRQGAVLGTPAYMSPEQSEGENGSLTPATDIYALGVILYEVLTGENPFRSKDVETTLTRVRAGEYKPPRAVNRRVPRALAAICTTAMARRREDRYEKAEHIVDDLRRFLAGEAVSVYEDPWWGKLIRWCRRRPALTAGAIGSVVVLTVSSTIFGAVVHRAHQAEMQARLAAENSHRQALERLSEAREAGDAWLIDLSGSLQFFPGMEGLRGQLLEQAAGHYQGLALSLEGADTDDAAGLLELAKCHLRLGDLHRLLERPERARGCYETAMAALTGGLERFTQEADRWWVRAELANARIGVALIDGAGRLAEDEAWLRSQLTQEEPPLGAEATNQAANTFARLALAVVRGERATPEAATRLLLEAETLAEQLLADRNEPRDHQLLQLVRDELAPRLRDAGRLKEAAGVWTAEVDRLGRRVEEQPSRPDLLQSRAFASMQLASLRGQLRRDHEAAEGYRSAIDDLAAAWRLSDADSYYRRNVAASHANLGRAEAEEGTAQTHLAEAIDHLRLAASAEGPSAGDLSRLAECYESLAGIAQRRGEPGALQRFDSAEQCYLVLADHGQAGALLAAKRARNLAGQARLRLDLGEAGEAAQGLAKADALLTTALADRAGLSVADRAWALCLEADLSFLRADLLGLNQQAEAAERRREETLDWLRALADLERQGGAVEAYPVAMQSLFDRLIERHDATPEALAEASGWLDAMDRGHAGCRQTAAWRQRRALLHWRQGEPRLARESIRLAIEQRPDDRLNKILLAAVVDGSEEAEIGPEAARRLAEEVPGDRRVRFWSGLLFGPQG